MKTPPATLADLAPHVLRSRLEKGVLAWRLGAVTVRARSRLALLGESLREIYGAHPLSDPDMDGIDFGVILDRPASPLGRLRGQIAFESEGEAPFEPLTPKHVTPMLEWGLNWCIARHANWHLMIHAASLHRNGQALVLPGPPGTGKSTLCAALVHAGWELLSDEFALISLDDGMLYPLWKPISLKNRALDLFRERESVRLTQQTFDSLKGRIGFWCLDFGPGGYSQWPAIPAWIAQLEYRPGAPLQVQQMRKSEAFLTLAQNSFNYSSLGERGFSSLFSMVEACECFDFHYSDLENAVALFDDLSGERRASA